MDSWYYKLFGAEFGPISFDEMVELAKNQTLSGDDEVRFGEDGVWRRAGSIGQLMTHLPYQAAKKPVSSSVSPNDSREQDAVGSQSNSQWSNDDGFETTAEIESPKVEEGWWCQILGNEVGPLTFDDIVEMAKNHTMSRDDQVRFGEGGAWRRAGSIGPLMAHFPFQAVERVITTGQKRTGDQIPVMDVPAPNSPVAQPVYNQSNYAQPAYPQPGYNQPNYNQPVYEAVAPAAYTAPSVQPAPVAQPAAIAPAAPVTPPTSPTPASVASDEMWWCLISDKEYGPVDLAKIKEWAANGRLHSYDYLRCGLADYVQASEVPGLFPKRPDSASKHNLSTHSIPTRPERTTGPKPPTDVAMSTMSDTAPSMTPAAEQRPYTPTSSPSSAAMSALSNSGSFGGGSSGFARAPAPVRRPTPARSSGGGFDLSALLLGPVGMGVGGVVVLGALIYFALPLLTGGNGAEIARLNTVQGGFNKIVAMRDDGEKPAEIKKATEAWGKAAAKVAAELKGKKSAPQRAVLSFATEAVKLAKLDLSKKNPAEADLTKKYVSAQKALKMK